MATLTLARHFFANAAGRAWLDEDGIESLRGVYFSALAGLASLGLFLPRRFRRQYMDLSALADPEPYRQALMADTLFMICLPALVIAFIAVLIAPVMFPDETDHVTLSPLPLRRAQIFGARLLALAALLVALVGGMVVIFSIAFPAFTHGRWATASWGGRIAAHATASAACATFAFVAVVAVQGLVLLLSPKRLLQPIAGTLQCASVALLVLTVPLIFRLPQSAAWVATEPHLLFFAPPAWFLGVEQVLLGNDAPYFQMLARIAGLALGMAAAVAAGCYLILYRHFDRIVFRQDRTRVDAPAGVTSQRTEISRRREATARPWRGVWEFEIKTLRRNRLSQLIFLVAWAAGVAVALNFLLHGWMWRLLIENGRPPRALAYAVATMPMAMIVPAIIGLRASFVLPANSRANWVFRLLDLPDRRSGHLAAVHRAFVRLAILPAPAICAPLQIYVLGLRSTLVASLLVAAFGLLIVEIVLADWRRVPFTCTWLPGKRPLPMLVVFGLVSLLLLFIVGSLIHAATAVPAAALMIGALLAAPLALLRRRRLRTWSDRPLQFEDEPIDAPQTLGLQRY